MTDQKVSSMANGVFYLDGKPMVFLSADYPYYRDDSANWLDRIRKLKTMGCTVITFYVPWRHHQTAEKTYDFTGAVKANKNVCHFIELVQSEGLYAVVKPGPFIHAETDFGGLPDNVNGHLIGECWDNSKGEAAMWHQPLPAPMSATFRDLAEHYFEAVNKEVIEPYLYPNGPVIALQVLNEGMYSDGPSSPVTFDYSASGKAFYYSTLKAKFGTVEALNEATGLSLSSFEQMPLPENLGFEGAQDIKALLPKMLWSENQNIAQNELYRRFSEILNPSVPHLFNINPPSADVRGYDHWLTRVMPETATINYGFTNWIGVVSHDETAFLRYLLLVKRARGINLEENWGFSKLYDWRYKFHHVPFYQTVLAMALGATGFNVYTGVCTDQWDDGIDTMQEKPYPDCSPITEHGEDTAKSELLKRLNTFLASYQELHLLGKREDEVAFGIYPPYSYLSGYSVDSTEYAKLGQKPVRSGFRGLDAFMQTQLMKNRDFSIANIESDSVEKLQEHKALVIVGGFFMSVEVQEKLIHYVQRGGKLVWLGELPEYDELFNKRQCITEYITDQERLSTTPYGAGQFIYNPENLFESGGSSNNFAHLLNTVEPASALNCESAYTFKYEKDGKRLVYILSYLTTAAEHTVLIDNEPLNVRLPAKGCAMIVLNGQNIEAALIKGINDYDNCQIVPAASWHQHAVEATQESDFMLLNGEVDEWTYSS